VRAVTCDGPMRMHGPVTTCPIEQSGTALSLSPSVFLVALLLVLALPVVGHGGGSLGLFVRWLRFRRPL